MKKRNIIITAVIITVILSLLLLLLGKSVEKLLAISALVIFMLFALLEPPSKHKDFGQKDIQKAVNHSLGHNDSTKDVGKLKKHNKNK